MAAESDAIDAAVGGVAITSKDKIPFRRGDVLRARGCPLYDTGSDHSQVIFVSATACGFLRGTAGTAFTYCLLSKHWSTGKKNHA